MTVAKFVNSVLFAALVLQVGGLVNTPPAAVKLPKSVALPSLRTRNSNEVVVAVNILRKSNADELPVWIAVPFISVISPCPFVAFHPRYPAEVPVGSAPAKLANCSHPLEITGLVTGSLDPICVWMFEVVPERKASVADGIVFNELQVSAPTLAAPVVEMAPSLNIVKSVDVVVFPARVL